MCVKCSEETRPGLIKNKTTQRSIAVAAKKARYDDEYREKMKPNKMLEQERRDEGLGIAISSKNKGFEMLAKMGYKQGQAIGKSSQGILEPIGIDIKSDRGGLGREAALKQLREHRQLIRLKRGNEGIVVSAEEFRKRMTQKALGNYVSMANKTINFLCNNFFTEKQMEADLG